MARTHARVLCAIWNDPDWTALEYGPQWLYQALLSQGSLNHAGVIGLTVRRWARGSSNMTVSEIEKWLGQLADSRFVVVDEDTEELLIRSFVRNDGVADQPNVLKAALQDARQVVSPLLRAVLADELRRLPAKREDTVRMKYPDPHAVADAIDPGPASPPPGKPSGKPSTKASASPPVEQYEDPSDLGQQTLDGTLPETLVETPRGRGRGRGSSSSSVTDNSTSEQTHTPASRSEIDSTPGFDAFYDAYPRRKDRLKAEKAYRAALRRGATPEHLLAAARRFAEQTRATEARFVAYPASWLNAGSYDNEPDPVTAPVRHLATAQPAPVGTARKRANAFLDLRRGTPA
jgi:hypothetical protein